MSNYSSADAAIKTGIKGEVETKNIKRYLLGPLDTHLQRWSGSLEGEAFFFCSVLLFANIPEDQDIHVQMEIFGLKSAMERVRSNIAEIET